MLGNPYIKLGNALGNMKNQNSPTYNQSTPQLETYIVEDGRRHRIYLIPSVLGNA